MAAEAEAKVAAEHARLERLCLSAVLLMGAPPEAVQNYTVRLRGFQLLLAPGQLASLLRYGFVATAHIRQTHKEPVPDPPFVKGAPNLELEIKAVRLWMPVDQSVLAEMPLAEMPNIALTPKSARVAGEPPPPIVLSASTDPRESGSSSGASPSCSAECTPLNPRRAASKPEHGSGRARELKPWKSAAALLMNQLDRSPAKQQAIMLELDVGGAVVGEASDAAIEIKHVQTGLHAFETVSLLSALSPDASRRSPNTSADESERADEEQSTEACGLLVYAHMTKGLPLLQPCCIQLCKAAKAGSSKHKGEHDCVDRTAPKVVPKCTTQYLIECVDPARFNFDAFHMRVCKEAAVSLLQSAAPAIGATVESGDAKI